MKKLLLLGALAVLGSTSSILAAPLTPWVTYNGHEYAATTAGDSWSGSHTTALGVGGDLVSIGDAAEQLFLNTTFGFGPSYWIGFTDQATEGSYLWTDGTPTAFTFWAGGEPNDFNGEDYAVMNWNGAGQWNDLPDNYAPILAIVERTLPSGTVPDAQSYTGFLAAFAASLPLLRRFRRNA